MYDIKEILLKNNTHEKKRLVITFYDETMAIVGEFLMTDAPLMDGEVTRVIETVLQGELAETTFTGQRCHLKITNTETTIEDLYEDIAGMIPLNAYTIPTETLLELTYMWLGRLLSLNNE